MRLDLKERQFLRLLEAALLVSEYTDKVDIAVFRNKAQRITNQLQQICSILSGLVVASDYKLGLELIADKDFKQNQQLFQFVFELGRRHKIMNPEKMRTECAPTPHPPMNTHPPAHASPAPPLLAAARGRNRLNDPDPAPRYGKLVYLLQDSLLPDVQQLLEFRIVQPLNVRPRRRTLRSRVDDLRLSRVTASPNPRGADGGAVPGRARGPEAAGRPAHAPGHGRDRRARRAGAAEAPDAGGARDQGEGARAGRARAALRDGAAVAGADPPLPLLHRGQQQLPPVQPRPSGPDDHVPEGVVPPGGTGVPRV